MVNDPPDDSQGKAPAPWGPTVPADADSGAVTRTVILRIGSSADRVKLASEIRAAGCTIVSDGPGVIVIETSYIH